MLIIGLGELCILIGLYLRDIPPDMIYRKFSFGYYLCSIAISQLFILFGLIGLSDTLKTPYGKYIFIFSVIFVIGGIHGISIITIKISKYTIPYFQKHNVFSKIQSWNYRISIASNILRELKFCYGILVILLIGYLYYTI